jgi:beta-1,4-mannosyltransferase
MIPDWRAVNPYQKALAKSLKSHGQHTDFKARLDWETVLENLFGRDSIDLLHIHWTHPFVLTPSLRRSLKKGIGFLAKLGFLKLRGISLVWTVHNLIKHDAEFVRTELFFNRLIAHLVNHMIAHSQYAKQQIKMVYKVHESKITVIPHGNYVNAYPRTISRVEARCALAEDEQAFVFLYFGMIRAYKGILDLINAFNSLNLPYAKLLVAGPPFDKTMAYEIKRLTDGASNIQLVLEYVPDDKIQLYMAASDIVVLPFRDIFTSGSLTLAMSFAKPVIASATGSIPEILDSRGGFLFETTEPLALQKAMCKAYHCTSHRLQQLGQHNLAMVRKFDWDTIAAKTDRIYRAKR